MKNYLTVLLPADGRIQPQPHLTVSAYHDITRLRLLRLTSTLRISPPPFSQPSVRIWSKATSLLHLSHLSHLGEFHPHSHPDEKLCRVACHLKILTNQHRPCIAPNPVGDPFTHNLLIGLCTRLVLRASFFISAWNRMAWIDDRRQ
jgi:hypothetical protein